MKMKIDFTAESFRAEQVLPSTKGFTFFNLGFVNLDLFCIFFRVHLKGYFDS